MKRSRTTSMIAAACAFSLAVAAASVVHAADDNKLSIPVAFGRGLNIPANQADNQVMIPDTVKLKQDGVVHFLVAGFHEIVIYNPGKTIDDVAVVQSETFINDASNRFYKGIVPAGGPPPALPVTTDPSNARNRVESVAFLEPGTYLVICNIRPHFDNGMFGYVEVK
jgi:plastocyanin